ncbi:hypothetical protein OH77DRAFT_1259007 [Trametes cingulata]|nr:hypothetical protein OH77DRAFT_1259007 [Trametes cingulata]
MPAVSTTATSRREQATESLEGQCLQVVHAKRKRACRRIVRKRNVQLSLAGGQRGRRGGGKERSMKISRGFEGDPSPVRYSVTAQAPAACRPLPQHASISTHTAPQLVLLSPGHCGQPLGHIWCNGVNRLSAHRREDAGYNLAFGPGMPPTVAPPAAKTPPGTWGSDPVPRTSESLPQHAAHMKHIPPPANVTTQSRR